MAMVQTVASIVGSPVRVTAVGDERKRFHRYVYADRHDHPIAAVTFSMVFDAVEVDPGVDARAVRRAVQAHADRQLDPSRRRVLDLRDMSAAATRWLLLAEEHAASGARLCAFAQGDLILVASANFLPWQIATNFPIVHESASVFAARIDAWSDDLEEYIHGVGGSPPVILGRFADAAAIAAFCTALSREAKLPGTTFDLDAVVLIEAMARYSDWAVALNQGDKGHEDAVLAVCAGQGGALDAMQEALTVMATVRF